MSRKAVRVVVELHFRGVSCPGVHLSDKNDIYLSVSTMGQFRQSECLPATFPLLFREKMTFEKIFRHTADPGDIAIMLEYESVRIELVQLIPPVGDTLACFEEDARRFLFPEPKLVPPFTGVDREVLMTRAPHFPGIAPKMEFSTKTTIIECSADAEVNIYPNVPMRPVLKRNRRPRTCSPRRNPNRGRRRGGSSRSPSYHLRSQSLSPQRAGKAQHVPGLSLDSASPGPASTSQPVKGTNQEDASSSDSHGSLYNHEGPGPALWQPSRGQTRNSRSQSSPSKEWEVVHQRVRGLLTTPKAIRRLVSGATHYEIDEVLARSSISPGPP